MRALELRDGSGRPVPINPVVVHEVMDAASVAGWQLVEGADDLRLLVVRSPDDVRVDPGIASTLTGAPRRQGAVVPPIRVEVVPRIEREPSGKVITIKPRRRAAAEVPA